MCGDSSLRVGDQDQVKVRLHCDVGRSVFDVRCSGQSGDLPTNSGRRLSRIIPAKGAEHGQGRLFTAVPRRMRAGWL